MRIIKPVLQSKQDALLAENAARAPYFLVFDDDKFIKFIKNPFVSGGGAGYAVADLLKDESCELFIAKKIGGNMKAQLDAYGIAYKLHQ